MRTLEILIWEFFRGFLWGQDTQLEVDKLHYKLNDLPIF